MFNRHREDKADSSRYFPLCTDEQYSTVHVSFSVWKPPLQLLLEDRINSGSVREAWGGYCCAAVEEM